MYLAVYGAFRREQCPGTKEEATSLSSASMCASTVQPALRDGNERR